MNLDNLQNEGGGGGVSPSAAQPRSLLGLSLKELTGVVHGLGEPDYRAKQLFQAIYRERLGTLDAISTLSKALKEKLLQAGWDIVPARIDQRFTSVDGTVRYLIGFPDKQSVETVWMPEGDLGESG